jgi:phosphoribosylformylglycinamidine cyclo-ligase
MDGYEEAGVGRQDEALSAVARHLSPTFTFPDAEVLTTFGHYAAAVKVSDDLALAICTDGVGSKTIIAGMLDRYDTIGFDCVAMNVNDLVCIGARPLALVDYLGVNRLEARRTDEILRGLGDAAKEAGIAVPGGEVAQLPEVIGSDGTTSGDARAFDLVGACIGTLHPDELILGEAVEPGDAIIGIASSGLHSNGYTLARRVLLKDAGYRITDDIPRLGRSLGEELLAPTEIYARATTTLWDAEIETRGLVHITGDGLLNLCRLEAEVGYSVDELPDPPPIFSLIQEAGGIDDAEMYRVFNMGIGFVVITPEKQTGDALRYLGARGYRAQRIGRVMAGSGVTIEPAGLAGDWRNGKGFFSRT